MDVASLGLAVKKYRQEIVLYVVFVLIYLILTFATPPDTAALHKYHLTSGGMNALLLTIALPYIVIWLIALVGYLRLHVYVSAIKDSKDGAAFHEIGQGILWFTLWLPLSAIVGAAESYYCHKYPSATAPTVLITNYVNLLILVPGFLFTYTGSQKLLKLIKRPRYSLPLKVMLAFIAFSALYTFLTLHDPSRRHPQAPVTTATYYLPDWLTVTTIIVPRLLSWFLGIYALYNLYMYQVFVKGELYKQALTSLTIGIGGVVGMVIVLRCLQSLANSLGKLGLNAILLVVYILLIVLSIAYIFIARGANKLKRIEDS
ncbi:MAG TPA: hypothetical protein VIJ68_01565 [Candidatus Saccharimonadales bacterium]